MKVPNIKNKIESISFIWLFAKKVSPTTTGKIVNNKRKSYRSKGPKVAIPMKNFEGSVCITFGYIESPENMTSPEIPTITTYEIKSKTFFLVEREVCAANSNVMVK